MNALVRRGMTLVELMVSMAIMGVVMTALVAVFIAVQQNYEKMSRSKTAVEGSRSATAYLERTVRMAGYGIDPRAAFDFGDGGTTKDNIPLTIDAGVPIVTDDLAFRWRDPTYLRRGGVDGTTLTIGSSSLGGTFGVTFPKFQRFVVMCPGGSDYVVVEANGQVASNVSTATVTVVTGNGFTNSSADCLKNSSGAAAGYVAVLQERRVRLVNVNQRLFLMAFRRIRDNAGNWVVPNIATTDLLYDPIATDVEDFQVAYVMNRPGTETGSSQYLSKCCQDAGVIDSAGNGNWVLLDAAGEKPPYDQRARADGPPWDVAYDHAARYTDHAANIRQVRISLVVRSLRKDRGDKFSTPMSFENYTRSSPVADGFLRLPMTTTIRVPNMLSRTGFTPDLRLSSGEGNFNGG